MGLRSSDEETYREDPVEQMKRERKLTEEVAALTTKLAAAEAMVAKLDAHITAEETRWETAPAIDPPQALRIPSRTLQAKHMDPVLFKACEHIRHMAQTTHNAWHCSDSNVAWDKCPRALCNDALQVLVDTFGGSPEVPGSTVVIDPGAPR